MDDGELAYGVEEHFLGKVNDVSLVDAVVLRADVVIFVGAQEKDRVWGEGIFGAFYDVFSVAAHHVDQLVAVVTVALELGGIGKFGLCMVIFDAAEVRGL